MPRKFSHDEAAEQMRAAGAEPLDVYVGANEPWRCRCLTCSREVTPRLNSVRLGRNPCLHCAQDAAKGRFRTDPEAAARELEAAGVKPLVPYPGAVAKWEGVCLKCGARVAPRLRAIRSGQSACNKCAKRRGGEKIRIPAATAEMEMRAAGAEPLEPYPGGREKWKCRCLKCGQIIYPRFNGIRQGRGPCASCGKAANKGRFQTKAQDAEFEMIAAGADPLEPFPGVHGKWRLRCLQCSREITSRLHDVRAGHRPCGWCAGQRVNPQARVEAMLAANLEPLEPYESAWAKWKCRCLKCGREVFPTYAGISQGEGGCKKCGKQSAADKRRGDPLDAALVMRAVHLEPLEPYRSSNTAWKCQCLICGNEVTPTLSSVRSGQSGCKYCAGKAIDVDAVTRKLAARGYTLLEPIKSSRKRVKAHCSKCNTDMEIRYYTIITGHSGCPGCARNTFSTAKPAIMYLLTHDAFLAYKVGIMNVGTSRLDVLGRYGWAVITRFEFETGRAAKDAENEMLAWIRKDLGFPPHLTTEDMPAGGESETFSAEAISVAAFVQKATEIAERRGGVRK